MAIIKLHKNTIEQQIKHIRDNITADEWNEIINQLRIQTNNTVDDLKYVFDEILYYKWKEYEGDDEAGIIITAPIPGVTITSVEELLVYLNSDVSLYDADELEYHGVVLQYLNLFKVVSMPTSIKGSTLISDQLYGTAKVYTETGPLSGFREIDGYTIIVGDIVFAAVDAATYGLYEVLADGSWERVYYILPNQVISIQQGNVYGGSMIKKTELGPSKIVKQPERSVWKVYI